MKLLIEKNSSNFNNLKTDGVVLSLKDYSVQSNIYYDLDEIEKQFKIESYFPNVNKSVNNETYLTCSFDNPEISK